MLEWKMSVEFPVKAIVDEEYGGARRTTGGLPWLTLTDPPDYGNEDDHKPYCQDAELLVPV